MTKNFLERAGERLDTARSSGENLANKVGLDSRRLLEATANFAGEQLLKWRVEKLRQVTAWVKCGRDISGGYIEYRLGNSIDLFLMSGTNMDSWQALRPYDNGIVWTSFYLYHATDKAATFSYQQVGDQPDSNIPPVRYPEQAGTATIAPRQLTQEINTLIKLVRSCYR